MSLSKEARIGILVTVAVVVFLFGFYMLKGSNLFSGEKEYYCFFDNVQGLQTSAAVQVRGLNVGRVSATRLEDNKGVMVTITLHKSVEVPQGTTAHLVSADLLGAKIIRLDPGNGPGMIEPKSQLPASVESGMLETVSTQIDPILKKVSLLLDGLDTTLSGVNEVLSDKNVNGVGAAIASLDTTMANFRALSGTLKKESGEITQVVHNANSITTNLANNNDKIQGILTNFNNISNQLANAPVKQTFDDLQKTIGELQGIMNKINTNQGSLGLLVNDKQLYNNLNSSLNTLNALMADINAHPSRYINVTIFGKKKP